MKFTDQHEIQFAIEEYKNLRNEISKKQDNHYKILNLGVGGIAILTGLGFSFVNELFIILPFLVIANHFQYMAEEMAIINTGKYLQKIEECFYGITDIGWERFCEKNRKKYNPFSYVAVIIFFSIFILCYIEGISLICIRRCSVYIKLVYYVIPLTQIKQ